MKKTIAITVSLLLICGAAYYFISFPADTFDIAAVSGEADLLAAVRSGQIARITSGWESYPGNLYTPEDFAAETVSAPAPWENKYGEGESVGTHRMRLVMPAGETTAIRFRSIDYATKIYINGELTGEIGAVGATMETTTPRVSDCYFVFTPETAETEIVLQYANFHHRRGGHPPEMTVGSPMELMRLAQKESFSQVIIAGLLFTAFLYHLAMFLLYGRRSPFLYFALCCLTFTIRAVLPFIIVFIPDYNWFVMIRLEYFFMFSGTVLLMLFFGSLFPKLQSKRVLWTVSALLVVYNILVIFTSPAFFSRLLIFVQPLCLLAVGYITVRLGIALKSNDITRLLAFIGIAFFLVTAINDVLFLNKLPNAGANLMPVGIAVFTLAYMMILSMEFAGNERRLEAEAGRLGMEMKMKEQALAADNAALEKLNRMKTEFIQDMSHEMKNPLTIIATSIDFSDRQIRKKDDHFSEACEALDTAREETQRLGRMISGMVNLASMDVSENRKRVDFAALLQSSAEAFRLTSRQRNNKLIVELAPGLPDVFIERDRFVQVMTNLFTNAESNTKDGYILLEADYDGSYITVRVSDTGNGIPPELMPNLFKRGISGMGGTGYGLYICKAIVEAHGGTIKIENKPGGGAVVTYTVPIYGGQEAGHML